MDKWYFPDRVTDGQPQAKPQPTKVEEDLPF